MTNIWEDKYGKFVVIATRNHEDGADIGHWHLDSLTVEFFKGTKIQNKSSRFHPADGFRKVYLEVDSP